MITSLAIIFIAGMAIRFLCNTIQIPHIIGLLFIGIVFGPNMFNAFDPALLNISFELRQMALVIIMVKAGLSLNITDLKRIGIRATLMALIPAVAEVVACVLFAPVLLGVTRSHALVMGLVLGAVSPAVVVAKMDSIIGEGYGIKKSIPQLITVGAALNDVLIIVLFYAFINLEQTGDLVIMDFAVVPVSIVLGIGIGAVTGWLLTRLFSCSVWNKASMKHSGKGVLIIASAFMLLSIEKWMEGIVPVSALLAILSMACVIKVCTDTEEMVCLSRHVEEVWRVAEILLFTLVGATVNTSYIFSTSYLVIIIILIALVFRASGVYVCLIRSRFNEKEKLFCILSYIPKATVQAVIGSVPLAIGLSCGNIVMSVAFVSIVITAPLGALLIDFTYKRLLIK